MALATKASQQALLNEYKGNLFEFLVSSLIAKRAGVEKAFLENLSLDMKNMLRIQQDYIFQHGEDLALSLQSFSAQTVETFFSWFKEAKAISHIEVLGKKASSGKSANEADILLKLDSGKDLGISLKLLRKSGYVNTKSGGVKSFFSHYFPCELSQEIQENFNDLFEREFLNLNYDFYDLWGRETENSFSTWVKEGMPTLSGDLNESYKKRYHDFLYVMNGAFEKGLRELYRYDKEFFINSLLPIVGFQGEESSIIQLICFYKDDESYTRIVEPVLTKKFLQTITFIDRKSNAANVELSFGPHILQLRLKAMNQFTSKTFKVNCSVKFSN